jgi:hypothetical protein
MFCGMAAIGALNRYMKVIEIQIGELQQPHFRSSETVAIGDQKHRAVALASDDGKQAACFRIVQKLNFVQAVFQPGLHIGRSSIFVTHIRGPFTKNQISAGVWFVRPPGWGEENLSWASV